MRRSVKRAVVIVSALAVTGVASAAWAAWLADGSGNAAAQAGTAKKLVVETVDTTASLYPETTGNATITITNPNTYGVAVKKVQWLDDATHKITASGGIGDCNNTGLYFGDFSTGTVGSNGLLTGLNLVVPAGATKTFTLDKAVRMTNNAENGCQNATFSIPVEVTGESLFNYQVN